MLKNFRDPNRTVLREIWQNRFDAVMKPFLNTASITQFGRLDFKVNPRSLIVM